MGFEPPDAAPAGQGTERRTYERREEDRADLLRTVAALLVAVCGGLAVIYLFFAAMGAVDIGDAVVATIIAVLMGLVWFTAFYFRQKNNAGRNQWRDRERRGF